MRLCVALPGTGAVRREGRASPSRRLDSSPPRLIPRHALFALRPACVHELTRISRWRSLADAPFSGRFGLSNRLTDAMSEMTGTDGRTSPNVVTVLSRQDRPGRRIFDKRRRAANLKGHGSRYIEPPTSDPDVTRR